MADRIWKWRAKVVSTTSHHRSSVHDNDHILAMFQGHRSNKSLQLHDNTHWRPTISSADNLYMKADDWNEHHIEFESNRLSYRSSKETLFLILHWVLVVKLARYLFILMEYTQNNSDCMAVNIIDFSMVLMFLVILSCK